MAQISDVDPQIKVGAHVRVDQESDPRRESWKGQVARVERIYGDLVECSWQPSAKRPRRWRVLSRPELSPVGAAEHVLRACVEDAGFLLVSSPEEWPSAQEPGAVMLRAEATCLSNTGTEAERRFRDLVDEGGLRVVGVPEASPNEQEPGIILLRVDVRVPAALLDGPKA